MAARCYNRPHVLPRRRSRRPRCPMPGPPAPAIPAGPYAFVSYASADRDRALAVADALEGAGIAVWLDRRSIAVGSSWSAEIVRGIRGCAALILLVSPAAMASPNVAQEVQLGWEGRRRLLPLLLEQAEP